MIINGAECEPYLTRDFRLMLERTDELVRASCSSARRSARA